MLSLLIMGRRFSCLLILPAIASGDWSSYKCFSTNVRRSGRFTIFMAWYFASCLRTYALWSAFRGSYPPLTVLRVISSEIVEGLRCILRAIARSVYFFSFRILISWRSLLERCKNCRLFFSWIYHSNFSKVFGFKREFGVICVTPYNNISKSAKL